MAAAFIGQKVLVTLKVPEGRQVEGMVAQVLTDSATLVLRNALFRDSGHRFVTWTVNGTHIADISFIEPPKPREPTPVNHAPPVLRQSTFPQAASPLPVDPAIVTFSKRHSVSQLPDHRVIPQEAPSSPVRPELESLPNASPVAPVVPLRSSRRKSKVEDAATLTAPFSALDIAAAGAAEDKHDLAGNGTKPGVPKARKPRRTKQIDNSGGQAAEVEAIEVTSKSTVVRARAAKRDHKADQNDGTTGKSRHKPTGSVNYRGKGWRQTPILKETMDIGSENNGATSPSPSKNVKNRRKNRKQHEELAGWATEDATDIQELPEFDFADNLAKFDKRGVFEQLRKEDTVAAEDRLVGHNRLKKPLWAGSARPGTFGGKNLHPSENVLDGPKQPSLAVKRTSSRRSSNIQPALSSESESDERELDGSSRMSSRARLRRLPVRTASNQHDEPVASNPIARRPSGPSVPRAPLEVSSGSGVLPRLTPSDSELPHSAHSSTATPGADSVQFILHENNNHPCPVITPGGMSALEDLADSEQNLTSDLRNENAGRSLADIIVRTLRPVVSQREGPISAIFLVGNHRTGARAIAAARHLRARGATCVCCVLGLDRPGQDLSPEIEKQVDRLGGAEAVIANWREVQKFLLHSEANGEFADVLVDGLLAPGHTYDTLVPEEQTAVREITSWANNTTPGGNRRLVMSIDVPCGINASTGEVTAADDGTRLQMRAQHIISMGAPRVGLQSALQRALTTANEEANGGGSISSHIKAILGVELWVVDIGVNRVWKTYGEAYGLATGRGVKFGLDWFSLLRVNRIDYEDEDDDEDTDDEERQ